MFSEKFEKIAKSRCWKGYKPVKGKKPYSPDSCEKIEKKASDDDFHKLKPLYTPRDSTREGKKKMVYVKSKNGGKRLIHYGATGYQNNYSEKARENFRSRHNCAGASKDTAKWWACNDLWNKKQDIGNQGSYYGKED